MADPLQDAGLRIDRAELVELAELRRHRAHGPDRDAASPRLVHAYDALDPAGPFDGRGHRGHDLLLQHLIDSRRCAAIPVGGGRRDRPSATERARPCTQGTLDRYAYSPRPEARSMACRQGGAQVQARPRVAPSPSRTARTGHFEPIVRELTGPMGREICLTSSPDDPILRRQRPSARSRSATVSAAYLFQTSRRCPHRDRASSASSAPGRAGRARDHICIRVPLDGEHAWSTSRQREPSTRSVASGLWSTAPAPASRSTASGQGELVEHGCRLTILVAAATRPARVPNMIRRSCSSSWGPTCISRRRSGTCSAPRAAR